MCCRSRPGTEPLQGLSKTKKGSKDTSLDYSRTTSPGQPSVEALQTPRGLCLPTLHSYLPALVAAHQTPAPAHPFSSREQRFLQKPPLLGLFDLVIIYSCWLGCVSVLLYATNALRGCHSKLQQPVASATHMWWL